MKTDVSEKLETPADQHHGYPLGVDGYMGMAEACEYLGNMSRDTLDILVKQGLIRKGRWPGRRQAAICRRSVKIYAKRLIEV